MGENKNAVRCMIKKKYKINTSLPEILNIFCPQLVRAVLDLPPNFCAHSQFFLNIISKSEPNFMS